MALKINSLTFVKGTDVPATVKNTELSQVVEAIHEKLKAGIPKGQAVSFKLDGAKKHTRFGLQSRLRKRGHKIHVRFANNTFFIEQAS